jgi:predicted ATPase
LTAALLERLAAEQHTRLRYFCSPQHTDSAFFPIVSQMERAAGFASDDDAQTKLDKLDTMLALAAALFAEMLALPNDGRYPAIELTPPTSPAENIGSANRTNAGIIAIQTAFDDL